MQCLHPSFPDISAHRDLKYSSTKTQIKSSLIPENACPSDAVHGTGNASMLLQVFLSVLLPFLHCCQLHFSNFYKFSSTGTESYAQCAYLGQRPSSKSSADVHDCSSILCDTRCKRTGLLTEWLRVRLNRCCNNQGQSQTFFLDTFLHSK